MPHFPRTPEPSASGDAEDEGRPRRRVGLPKINLHTYTPDEDVLFETLLGKDFHVDPHTGNLVRKCVDPDGTAGR
jgi:hypothetical protein